MLSRWTPATSSSRTPGVEGHEGLVDAPGPRRSVDPHRGRMSPADGATSIDAEGCLVTPPLVDCHLHLDASLTAGRPRFNESGTLIEGIHVWGELKESLTEDDVYQRAKEVVEWSAAQGTLFIRAHADVSAKNEVPLRGLLRVRDDMAELVTMQVTAFPQDGIYSDPQNEELLEQALQLGADCVGGIPALRADERAGPGRGAPGLRSGQAVPPADRRALRRDGRSQLALPGGDGAQHRPYGMAGRVTASHCTAMGSYEPYYSSKLLGFLQRSGINMVVNPFANSLIQGRLDPYPKRRGFAQLKELLAHGRQRLVGQRRHHGPLVPDGPGRPRCRRRRWRCTSPT